MRVPIALARRSALHALRQVGTPPDHAESQVDLLVEADLRGHPSHGLARLPLLLDRIRNGLADPAARGRFDWHTIATLVVDGRRGLGPVVGQAALERLSERARDTGIALATVSNSNHLGMLAWYVERVAADGQVAIAVSTSEALVHPYGGTARMVGTNPLAVAIPAEPAPLVVDMATGIVSMGRIHDHRRRGEPLPSGWAVDAAGNPTTDAAAATDGAIAPFGGAKGYALGLATEVLVASLTGAALGTHVRGTLDATHPCNKGDLFVVIDVTRDAGTNERISGYLDAIRNCQPTDPSQPVTVPGDRARARRAAHLADGIVVADEVWAELTTTGVPPP